MDIKDCSKPRRGELSANESKTYDLHFPKNTHAFFKEMNEKKTQHNKVAILFTNAKKKIIEYN